MTVTPVALALLCACARLGQGIKPQPHGHNALARMTTAMDWASDVRPRYLARDILGEVMDNMMGDFVNTEDLQNTTQGDEEDVQASAEEVSDGEAEADDEQGVEVQKSEAASNSSAGARGMLMKLEIMKMDNTTKFFVRFDHGCKPVAGRLVVNCIFALGEKVKYMWAFRSEKTIGNGDEMVMTLMPRVSGRASSFLKRKGFMGRCPACGSKCRTKYGDMKMELPLAPCDAPMDVGFHTLYRVPKEMPDITFEGRAKMQRHQGKVETDLKITWAIGSIKKLSKMQENKSLKKTSKKTLK